MKIYFLNNGWCISVWSLGQSIVYISLSFPRDTRIQGTLHINSQVKMYSSMSPFEQRFTFGAGPRPRTEGAQ